MLTRPVVLVFLCSLGIAVPCLATEPGTPMDCSDLELAPGLTCMNVTEPADNDLTATRIEEAFAVDNDGRLLTSGSVEATGATCGAQAQPISRRLHVRLVFGGTPLVASTDRCGVGSRSDAVDARGFYFDALRGSLYLSLKSFSLQPAFVSASYFDSVW